MGKKGSSKKAPNATFGPQIPVTIREASTGKKEMNAKNLLKLEHIKNLAVWASRDAVMPPLGAFFGHHLAAFSESLGTPADPSLFTCQRCESILHPKSNCTIRIEKNKIKPHHKGKKTTVRRQNNIVHTCHFCSHRNIKRGTLRDKSPPKPKANEPVNPTIPVPLGSTAHEPGGKMGISEIFEKTSPVTPSGGAKLSLLESKMKKRKRSGAKKGASSKSAYEGLNTEKTNRKRRKS